MHKAGSTLGIIAGVLGIFAAIFTIVFGGIDSSMSGSNTLFGLGIGGLFFSFISIIVAAMAVSKPKGAGIALIITAILGFILGGTFVAVFMILTLIAGILSIMGAGSAAAPHLISSDETTAQIAHAVVVKKSKKWLWIPAVILSLPILFVIVAVIFSPHVAPDPIITLEQATISSLTPDGELADIFSYGSDYTDLQRENKIASIKDKVVCWQLPVFDVSKQGDIYRVQTKSSIRNNDFAPKLVETFIYITPRNDNERQALAMLKTDDLISFKGVISGEVMRSLHIKPALLIVQ